FSEGPADPLANFTATINWGDGATSSATVALNSTAAARFVASGSHTYAAVGDYTVTVTLHDPQAPSTTASGTAHISNITATPVTISPVEGAAFTGTVANFNPTTAGSTASSFTASITWGDGHTSTGTIAGTMAAGFTVTGTNTYAKYGSYPV